MELSSDLIREFAKNTKDESPNNVGSTVYGTFRIQDGINYVQIDGSDTRTPVASTVTAKNGDRVTVLIKDHKAIVTGNLEDPSASSEEVEEVKKTMGQSTLDIERLKQQLENQEITLDEYREAIADAKRMATDYIDFTAGTGLVIGSTSISNNVRIYSGGIDIRDGDTILASYTDDIIYLGKENTTASIDFCSGRMRMMSNTYDTSLIAKDSEHIGFGMVSRYNKGDPLSVMEPGIRMTADDGISGSQIHAICDRFYIGVTEIRNIFASIDHSHSNYYESGDNIHANYLYIASLGSASQQALYCSTKSGIVGTDSSSSRYKNSIEDVKDTMLDPHRLYDLPIRQFKWNEGHFDEAEEYNYDTLNVGFIAEEVAEIYPYATVISKGQIESWEVRRILPPMLALIQEQKKEIDSLTKRIETLEGKEVSQ